MDEERNTLDIYLGHLLNKDIPAEIRDKSCYKDNIGRDGFSGHVLESVLCIMEISDAFNCDFMQFPDDEKHITVKDLVEFVVQKNTRTIKN